MLREIISVKQEPGAGRRRWFESDQLELIVWLDAEDALTGFQLCYDLGQGEHALTWRDGSGFVHSRVDLGDDTPMVNRAPVLQPDGPAPWDRVALLFDQHSQGLEPALRRWIQDHLGRRCTAVGT